MMAGCSDPSRLGFVGAMRSYMIETFRPLLSAGDGTPRFGSRRYKGAGQIGFTIILDQPLSMIAVSFFIRFRDGREVIGPTVPAR